MTVETDRMLEEAARRAEQRKNDAIERLMGRLGPTDRLERAREKQVAEEKGR